MRWRAGRLRLFARPKLPGIASEDVAVLDRARGHFAVCDGATQSYHPRGWAGRLARAYVADGRMDAASLAAAQNRFQRENVEAANDRYRRAAFSRGSFATLLGFTLTPEALEVTAFGDSLLMVDGHQGQHLVPPLGQHDFGSSPVLLPSHADAGAFRATPEAFASARTRLTAPDGGWPGTRILVMTDALAAWLLAGDGIGHRVEILLDLESPVDFCVLVGREIDAGRMKLDDVTLLMLEPGS